MLIDWFTVGAQVLNFVVLVWLMKRFLYQPVLQAIAAREKRIADQIANAAAKEAQAQTERQAFDAKNTAFDQQRAALLSQATAQATAEGLRLSEEAQKAAEALAAQHQQSLAFQALHLQQLIASRAAHEVFAVVRKTLADLANVGLEERMVEVFMQRLGALTGPAKEQLVAALQHSAEPALVRSCFALLAEQQAAICQAIKQAFSADVPLHFETAADAVCGIELRAGGQKWAWTIDEYLRDLEHNVAALLQSTAVAP
ncbi:ATP synthase subunit B [Simplicispira psychrophila]|uniref:ATP synthase subunit B n=1 Tax=Simplicispira psychrophila TaxID=80882 RepID=UPI00068F63BC|nr:ATP synthase subunit B [Simplicispira psychrophila]